VSFVKKCINSKLIHYPLRGCRGRADFCFQLSRQCPKLIIPIIPGLVLRSATSPEEDLSFDKSITITEKSHFHIGMIFNNAFNRHYWGAPDIRIHDSNFGESLQRQCASHDSVLWEDRLLREA
jgi:hypothetical protein